MYWIKIKEIDTGEETVINFEDRKQAELYRNYHCEFDAWDKKEVWVAEKFLNPNHKKLIVEEKQIPQLNSKKEEVLVKYFKIKPKFIFLEDNLGLTRNKLLWEQLREERRQVLITTDCTMLADYPLTTKERALFREYREYLRNLPLSYNDTTIDIYRIMTLEEWKDFFKKN